MRGIKEFADITYLTPENSEFYETDGKMLGMKFSGEDKGRVFAYRMFPLNKPYELISIRTSDKKEVGIIEKISDFDKTQSQFIKRELSRRYFMPKILKVKHLKEEFSYVYWDVETDSGDRKFSLFDMRNSIINLGGGRILLVDIDGNRYEIEDMSKISDKAIKFLEIWI